jgi:dethiobiotin synthetase
MPGLFVTAIGTDVGKTYVACALVAAARRRALAVRAYKPVVTGLDLADAAACAASDPGRLLAALGEPCDAPHIAAIVPWIFRDPISPDIAAAREGRTIDVDGVIAFVRHAVASAPEAVVIVEGIGGVLVPLHGTDTIGDVIEAANMPAVLVAATYLGSLSHTFTACESLAARDIDVRAIAVSESPDAPVSLAEACAVIERYVRVPVIPFARGAAARNEHAADDLLQYFLDGVQNSAAEALHES